MRYSRPYIYKAFIENLKERNTKVICAISHSNGRLDWPSVADPGCLSRIMILFTHHGSRIQGLGSRIQKQQQKRGVKKKNCCHIFFFLATNFTKIVNYFTFEMLKKKIWASFERIKELFTQKLSLTSQKYGFGIRNPRSGIR